MQPEEATPSSIVFFDGVCNLCNRSVNWLIDRDTRERLLFAPLQGGRGQALLGELRMPATELSSIVFLKDGRATLRSTAVLGIAQELPYPWPLAGKLLAIPEPLRDRVYDFVARNRYRWFGRQESCRLPTPELQRRFLS